MYIFYVSSDVLSLYRLICKYLLSVNLKILECVLIYRVCKTVIREFIGTYIHLELHTFIKNFYAKKLFFHYLMYLSFNKM